MRVVFYIFLTMVMSCCIQCGSTKPEQYGKSWSKLASTDSIEFAGGNGYTMETPVIINGAKSMLELQNAIFNWIEMLHGVKFVAWTIKEQTPYNTPYKQLSIYTIIDQNSKKEYSYFFDISELDKLETKTIDSIK